MNVNFSVFIDKILSGEKRQTIRRSSPKWENVKAGEKLTLYTGLRTKECRKLGEAVVESITPITIDTDDSFVEIHTPLGDFKLSYLDLEDLAGRDGFDDVRDFFTFFWNMYFWSAHCRKRPQFAETKIEMVVIRWKDFKEVKDETSVN